MAITPEVFKKFLVFCFFSIMMALSGPSSALAIGITPSEVVVDDLLPGASVERVINFSRGNPLEDEKAIITIEGDAAPYIFPLKPSEIILPKGENLTPYPFLIKPKRLGSGTYRAAFSVVVKPIPKEGEKFSGSAVQIGVRGSISFTVTNAEKEEYEIKNIIIHEFEEQSPLALSFQMNNTGNVDTRLGSIEIQVKDIADPSFSAQRKITSDNMPIVKAFSEQTISLVVSDLLLHKGKFEITVFAMNIQGEKIIEQLYPLVQILPQGSLAQKGVLKTFTSDKDQYDVGEIAQFSAQFENSGSIGLYVTLEIELFQGDKRIEVLKSPVTYVPVARTVDLSRDFRIAEGALYRAKAFVSYGSTKTETLETSFSVGALSVGWIIGAIIAAIFSILGIGMLVRRKFKR